MWPFPHTDVAKIWYLRAGGERFLSLVCFCCLFTWVVLEEKVWWYVMRPWQLLRSQLGRSFRLLSCKKSHWNGRTRMHAWHDTEIIHGDWVGSKRPQKDYIKITSFDRCFVSLILFSLILSVKYVPDSCTSQFRFQSSTLTLSPTQAKEALLVCPSFPHLWYSLSCFCAISTFTAAPHPFTDFQSSLLLLLPQGQFWKPLIALGFSCPTSQGLQVTRKSCCSENPQEPCSHWPSHAQFTGIGANWAANLWYIRWDVC